MEPIEFEADKVSIQTGKPDNSAVVKFEIGEYHLDKIKDLVNLIGVVMKVRVEVEE